MSGTPSVTPVTVLGLGAMGSALATAFLDGGHPVTVWNRTPAKAGPLTARGAVAAADPREAVRAADLVVLCVLDYAAAYATLGTVGDALQGRTLVQLTNGTPAQAREFAQWATQRGAHAVDGGIMAIPPMIGSDASLTLYSGDRDAFDRHRAPLGLLGGARWLGTDPGAAALCDLALLSGMYGMFAGALHATALATSDGGSATEFTGELLVPWLTAMMTAFPDWGRRIDAGDFRDPTSNLAMQSAGFVNLIEASAAQGVDPLLMTPVKELLDRAVAEGFGDRDTPALATLLAKKAHR
ncbi:NAD(P)-dependent oxidoreductase [Streptomyces sp. NPDC059853]|uniref:NAD(P)-dependent oxidoreductase n=1 Tax=Streptomyces sp. NPDC059853 TaxID=3346973 RepID=UPI00365A227E